MRKLDTLTTCTSVNLPGPGILNTGIRQKTSLKDPADKNMPDLDSQKSGWA